MSKLVWFTQSNNIFPGTTKAGTQGRKSEYYLTMGSHQHGLAQTIDPIIVYSKLTSLWIKTDQSFHDRDEYNISEISTNERHAFCFHFE